MLTCLSVYNLLSLFLEFVKRLQWNAAWLCGYAATFSNPRSSQPAGHRRSVVYAIWYPSDFRCIRVLNLALVGCARCTLGFRFPVPKKYAHQNDHLNQGDVHELKLRLKIVRYPGIEVVLMLAMTVCSSLDIICFSQRQNCLKMRQCSITTRKLRMGWVTRKIRRKYFAERVLHKNKSWMDANKSGSKDYQQQEKIGK